MSDFVTFEIAGDNALALRCLAEEDSLTPADYLDQAIRVGLTLADFALGAKTSDEDNEAEVLFQRDDGEFVSYAIDDFEVDELAQEVEIAGLESQMVILTDEKIELDINKQFLELILFFANKFDTSSAELINASVFFRWQWGLSRRLGGLVLIRENPESECRAISMEYELTE